MDENVSYDEMRRMFEKTIGRAVRLSETRMGVEHTGRQNRALFVYAKLVTHSLSVLTICDNALKSTEGEGLLDHFSIGALTRVIVDTAIMTMYLSEPSLTKEEWDLRRKVLYLHDLVNRKRYLDVGKRLHPQSTEPQFYKNYPTGKLRLQKEIAQNCIFLGFSLDQSKELQNGQKVFLFGVRGAAKEAGFGVKFYDFVQVYLSNHVHAHPGSYMNAEEQGISFTSPSLYQYEVVRFCLAVCKDTLDTVNARMESFTGHRSDDPLDDG